MIEVAGIVPAPISEVRATLLDLEAFDGWFPGIGEWRVLFRDDSSARIYGAQLLPWPIDDRDYVVRYRWWTEASGAFHLESRAQRDAELQAVPGRVRIEDMRTEWRLQEGGGETEVVYVYEGRTGIPLPGWVLQLGWKGQTGRLLDALAREVARRSAASR
jgi:hypothetical protein